MELELEIKAEVEVFMMTRGRLCYSKWLRGSTTTAEETNWCST